MKDHTPAYVAAVVAIAVATIAGYAVPLVIRFSIDSVVGGHPVEFQPAPGLAQRISDTGIVEYLRNRLWLPALAIVLATLFSGAFHFLQKRWAAVASERTVEGLRNRLYDHLQLLSYDYHVKAETGDLIQRCTSDVDTIRRFLSIQLVEVGRAIILLATAYPLLFGLHRPLAFLSVPIVTAIFLFSVVFYRRVQSAFKRSDESEGRLSTVLQENLAGVRVVRAFGRQRYELEKFALRNTELRDLTAYLVRVFATFWGASDLLAMGHMMVTLLVGTWFAVQGSLTVGDLVVFITVESMLLWPVRQLGRILADMGKATVSLGRINEILETPTEYSPTAEERPQIKGRVEFSNVRFAYDDGREILKGVSFVVEPGMTVAILGATGSGKSSLVHLIPRLYDYTSGSIRIDGVELTQIDKRWIRSHVGFVLQEPFLYAKTLKRNIGLARGGARDAEIFEAARDAAIHDVIERFDRGYETLVGERGVTLSGGQKQRVAIARALITENPILVFDDSLSAVDTETDAAIRLALAKRTRRATTFIISHRVATLASADLILVLEDGHIVQSGRHEDLVDEQGLYRRIWEMQEEKHHDAV